MDFERRTQARLDLVLEEVCRQLSAAITKAASISLSN